MLFGFEERPCLLVYFMHEIHGNHYKTLAAIKRDAKARLAAYGQGYFGDLNKEDAEWFVDLVRKLHPYPKNKLYKPIVGVEVYVRYGVANNNLRFIYEDGTSCPFSWNKCCKSKASGDTTSIKNALRDAINDQVVDCLNTTFACTLLVLCPMTGKLLDRKSAHVDHAPPAFADIVLMWLRKQRIKLPDIALADDVQGGQIMAPGPQRESWVAFHKSHARLRVVCAQWNISAGRHEWKH